MKVDSDFIPYLYSINTLIVIVGVDSVSLGLY